MNRMSLPAIFMLLLLATTLTFAAPRPKPTAAPNMTLIHAQFAAKDAEIASLKAQIAALKQEIAALRGQSGQSRTPSDGDLKSRVLAALERNDRSGTIRFDIQDIERSDSLLYPLTVTAVNITSDADTGNQYDSCIVYGVNLGTGQVNVEKVTSSWATDQSGNLLPGTLQTGAAGATGP